MQFKVPQFIEREAKVLGSLTFRQFLYIGIGGAIIFFLYYSLAQLSFFLFIILTVLIASFSVALAFMKVDGHPLPAVFLGFTGFISGPKVFLWQRKSFTPQVKRKETVKNVPIKDSSEEVKIFRQSRLKSLSNEIEIKK